MRDNTFSKKVFIKTVSDNLKNMAWEFLFISDFTAFWEKENG